MPLYEMTYVWLPGNFPTPKINRKPLKSVHYFVSRTECLNKFQDDLTMWDEEKDKHPEWEDIGETLVSCTLRRWSDNEIARFLNRIVRLGIAEEDSIEFLFEAERLRKKQEEQERRKSEKRLVDLEIEKLKEGNLYAKEFFKKHENK